MSKSKVDILHQKFSKSFLGYRKEEVDVLLQELAEEIGKLTEENSYLKSKIEEMEKAISEYKSREKILQNTLITTQKMVEEVKANAHKQAKNIIEEAQNKAEEILNQAHKRLSQIHADITELKRHKSRFEVELRSLLEAHLKLLEKMQEEDSLENIEEKIKFMVK